MSSRIQFYTRFKIKEPAGGGVRRELQIIDDLESLGIDVKSPYDNKSILGGLAQKLKIAGRDAKWWQPGIITYLSRIRYYSYLSASKLTKETKLVIVDDPLFFPHVIKKADLLGIPVAANCHNIESLCIHDTNSENQRELLNYELKLYGMVKLVICISYEEAVFFRNVGLDAIFYPYHPSIESESRLIDLRNKRRESNKEYYLFVGNINNYVSREGLEILIDYWAGSDELNDRKMVIAGLGTEKLLDKKSHNIEIKGPVSEDELNELIIKAKAAIIYQRRGAGALTKIADFLIAGVPVIANLHAARSWIGREGLTVFDEPAELPALINSHFYNNFDFQQGANPERLRRKIEKLMENNVR